MFYKQRSDCFFIAVLLREVDSISVSESVGLIKSNDTDLLKASSTVWRDWKGPVTLLSILYRCFRPLVIRTARINSEDCSIVYCTVLIRIFDQPLSRLSLSTAPKVLKLILYFEKRAQSALNRRLSRNRSFIWITHTDTKFNARSSHLPAGCKDI